MAEKGVIQLNFKAGNLMVNVYADSIPEAEELLTWVDENGEVLVKVQTMLDATHNVHAPQYSPNTANIPQQRSAPASAPAGGAAPCDHGQRVYKTGTNKTTGKSWAGWFCPSSVDGCKPVWEGGRR